MFLILLTEPNAHRKDPLESKKKIFTFSISVFAPHHLKEDAENAIRDLPRRTFPHDSFGSLSLNFANRPFRLVDPQSGKDGKGRGNDNNRGRSANHFREGSGRARDDVSRARNGVHRSREGEDSARGRDIVDRDRGRRNSNYTH